jgi:hypothetical protein
MLVLYLIAFYLSTDYVEGSAGIEPAMSCDVGFAIQCITDLPATHYFLQDAVLLFFQ